MEFVRYIYEHWFKTLMFLMAGGWAAVFLVSALPSPLLPRARSAGHPKKGD